MYLKKYDGVNFVKRISVIFVFSCVILFRIIQPEGEQYKRMADDKSSSMKENRKTLPQKYHIIQQGHFFIYMNLNLFFSLTFEVSAFKNPFQFAALASGFQKPRSGPAIQCPTFIHNHSKCYWWCCLCYCSVEPDRFWDWKKWKLTSKHLYGFNIFYFYCLFENSCAFIFFFVRSMKFADAKHHGT